MTLVAIGRVSAAAVFFGGLVLSSMAHAQAPTLGIDEAIRLALTRNERARVAELQVDVADAAVDRARAGFLPTVVLQGTGTQRAYEIQQQGRIATPYNSGSSTLTVNQPVVSVPAFPLYRQAQRLLDAQKFQSAEDKRTLAFDAARAFVVVLSEQQILQAAMRRVDLAKAGLADMQARVEAQLNSTNDVTRAQLELASADHEVENDRGLLERAVLQLAFLLNTKIQGELAPPTPTLKASEQTVANVDALVAAALPKRMDVLASRHRMIAARIFATEPMYRLVPTLGVAAQFRAVPEVGNVTRWDDETLGVTLTWTIYDAGIRYADRRSRDAQASIAELDLQTLQRNVDTQVRLAVAALQSAQSGYRYAVAAVEASRRSVDETAILYRQGLARAIEVTDASGARFVAEVNLAVAQFGMAQAYLDLRFAMGLEPMGTELR